MAKFLDEITGRGSRKRRERDLQKNINEFKQAIGGSNATLRALLDKLSGESSAEQKKLELNRLARSGALSELIGKQRGESESATASLLDKLRGGVESAFGEFGGKEAGLEDRLRQAILGSLSESRTGLQDILGRKETGIRSELDRYLQGEFANELPEIEARLAGRGLSLQGGTAGESLAKELARLGGVRFQTLSGLEQERFGSLADQFQREAQVKQALEGQLFGTGREDLLNRLQQSLNVNQQGAQLGREDFLRGQQQQFEDYLRNLGFARENEQLERGFGYQLKGQRLPLEQQLQQNYLQSFQPQMQLAQQQLAGAQNREGSFYSGLAGLAGNIFTNFALPRWFPSAQDNLYKALAGQYSSNIPRGTAGMAGVYDLLRGGR